MRIILLSIAFLFSGCYKIEAELPPSIFNEVKQVERPEVKTLEDIQKSYIFLFDAYQHNLNLIKVLQKSQKKK